jgi:hypothetical protein
LEFNKLRTLRSIVRRLKFPLCSTLFVLAFVSNLGVSQQSDDEEQRLRKLFLKSRQTMEIVPSPTPSPKPTPSPATSPVRHPSRSASPAPTRSAETVTNEKSEEKSPTPSLPAHPEPTAPQVISTPLVQNVATPTPTPRRKHHWFLFGKRDDNDNSIVVQKSGAQDQRDLVPASGSGGMSWQYLTPAVRSAIDNARVVRNRWKYIIVHNSGTRQGNARIFDYYHRYVRHMPNGLAYHFVIGNGTSSGNGQVEVGNRWFRQLSGGHVHSDYLNYISIGICLVGDFNRDLPTKAEYEALDELIRYLRRRVGKVDNRYSIVRGHKEINPVPTDCPGNRFPLTWLHRSFPD